MRRFLAVFTPLAGLFLFGWAQTFFGAAAVVAVPACSNVDAAFPGEISGIEVLADTLTAGHGCGTGPAQIYKYIALVSVPTNVPPPLLPGLFVAGATNDCFSNAIFQNLCIYELDGGADNYALTVYAFTQDQWNLTTPDAGADDAGADDAGDGGAADATSTSDASTQDASAGDASTGDASVSDASTSDAGDAAVSDAGRVRRFDERRRRPPARAGRDAGDYGRGDEHDGRQRRDQQRDVRDQRGGNAEPNRGADRRIRGLGHPLSGYAASLVHSPRPRRL